MYGDADYIKLISHLKSEGVRVEIAAVLDNTAKIVVDNCDYFHPITKDDWFVLAPTKKQPSAPRT